MYVVLDLIQISQGTYKVVWYNLSWFVNTVKATDNMKIFTHDLDKLLASIFSQNDLPVDSEGLLYYLILGCCTIQSVVMSLHVSFPETLHEIDTVQLTHHAYNSSKYFISLNTDIGL